MGVFDNHNDTPFQIKTEGETIALTFSSGLPATGQATIQWNLPVSANGCSQQDLAYCGMVVVLSNSPLTINNAPKDGVKYVSDATADFDLHAGDTINGAIVIGAFYEGDKKSRGEQLTTSFIINDIDSSKTYYVAGYAVDCQLRHHRDGVRGYSDNFGKQQANDLPASQLVKMGQSGVLPTDGTGLTPGLIYQFELELDPTFPDATQKKTVLFSQDGINISTYQDLIKQINKTIATVDNPPESPLPLNAGRYYWNQTDTQLFLWDGYQHNVVDFIYQSQDPSSVVSNDYWFDTTNNILNQWQGSPGSWVGVNFIEYSQDPTQLDCDDYWFDGSNGYKWNGSNWCQQTTYIDSIDPTDGLSCQTCGLFWYNQDDQVLQQWNVETQSWTERYAISWDVAPNNLVGGTYWFDNQQNQLQQWDGVAFNVASATISDDEPTTPSIGSLWYTPTNEQLFHWDGTQWIEDGVIVWPTDPSDVQSCNLWWNSTDNNLYSWDVVNSSWQQVTQFVKQPDDPLLPQQLALNSLWFNTNDQILYNWDGSNWVAVNFINYSTDPTQPAVSTPWFNTQTETWFTWDGATWNSIDVVSSSSDPQILANGTLWFDSDDNILYERSGSSWIVVPHSTTPFTPKKFDKWYDTQNCMLMQWDGSSWIECPPLATAALNQSGNLVFTSSFTGSNSCLMILVPQGSDSGATSTQIATGTAGHDYHHYSHYGLYSDVATPETSVSLQTFLFDYLRPQSQIYKQRYGIDAVSGTPSYEELGIGSDGSVDERRELASSIREQLGYPTVDVELTPKQIDTAIDLALEELRKRSSVAYHRTMFFIDVIPGQQHYILSNRTVGFNKVVNVMSAHRFTSAFLSTAHGSGVYGQVVLQHLYNMGTFDLVSYHLVSQYIEQLEHLFATRLTFNWNEDTRKLGFYHTFAAPERILLDTVIEKTEQQIFVNRWSKTWIEKWALKEAMLMLAQIRGKFATLPGAGGGVSLNAADLYTRAAELEASLLQQIDDYVVNDIENIGQTADFVIG